MRLFFLLPVTTIATCSSLVFLELAPDPVPVEVDAPELELVAISSTRVPAANLAITESVESPRYIILKPVNNTVIRFSFHNFSQQRVSHLLSFMRVFVLSFVIELLRDEAAQTQNPFVILNPYH